MTKCPVWKDNHKAEEFPSEIADEARKEAYNYFLNKSFSTILDENKELLVYPEQIRDATKEIPLLGGFYTSELNSQLETHNLMGVVTYHYKFGEETTEVPIIIGSRFDEGREQRFFIYLLSHAFDFSIVNLDPQIMKDNLWDILLVFLFAHNLEKAYCQGLFKQYITKKYNNLTFKGSLAVQRHIKSNVPFLGNIAHDFREMSYDNPVLWLVRYTADRINGKYALLWKSLLRNKHILHEAVRVIGEGSPSYTPQNRHKILQAAIKPIRHPFYFQYEGLRKICLSILRDEGLNIYNQESEKVHGVLFDGSWLWECYIANLLSGLGFKHLEMDKTDCIYPFIDKSKKLYPDHFKDDIEPTYILDSKYKAWNWNSDDIKQVLAYMYITGAKLGGVIHPLRFASEEGCVRIEKKTITKQEKLFLKIALQIPDSNDNFIANIKEAEKLFIESVRGVL